MPLLQQYKTLYSYSVVVTGMVLVWAEQLLLTECSTVMSQCENAFGSCGKIVITANLWFRSIAIIFSTENWEKPRGAESNLARVLRQICFSHIQLAGSNQEAWKNSRVVAVSVEICPTLGFYRNENKNISYWSVHWNYVYRFNKMHELRKNNEYFKWNRHELLIFCTMPLIWYWTKKI